MSYGDQNSISAIGKVRYTDSGDVSRAYSAGQISINYDSKTFGMASVAVRVNDAMGLSKGMDGIIKNYNIVEDYNNGGMSRYFVYNAPQSVTFFSLG